MQTKIETETSTFRQSEVRISYLVRLSYFSYCPLTFKETMDANHVMAMQYLDHANVVSVTVQISIFYTNLEVVVQFQFQSLKNEKRKELLSFKKNKSF